MHIENGGKKLKWRERRQKEKARQRNVKTGKKEKLTKKEKENTSLIAKLRECKES